MGTFGTETILVGDVVHGVRDAVGTDEAVGSTDAEEFSGSIVFVDTLSDFGLFLALLSIALFKVPSVTVETDVVVLRFSQQNYVAVVDGLLGELLLLLLTELGSGKSYGHQGGEYCDLKLQLRLLFIFIFHAFKVVKILCI